MLELKEPLTHTEKQFVLYTKGHYEGTGDKIEDLKLIVAEAYRLPENDVQMYSVVHFVSNVFDKLITSGYINTGGHPTAISFLLNNIFRDNLKRDDNSLINFMCARVQWIPVVGLDLVHYDTKELKVALKGKERL